MANVLSSTTVHSGRVFAISVDRVRLPHGREATLEVVRHPPSAILIPMPDREHVVLVRQYRYPVDRFLWELPAGSIDEGETVEEGARRECHEEIGLVPAAVEKLATVFPTPGYCDEAMNFFRVTDLREGETAAHQDLDEHLEVRTFSLQEARAMVSRGEITDMKTIVGLMLA